jgi:HAD superfamily hydrolase (TIGR01450 family)
MVDREGMDEFWGIPHDVENPEYIIVGDNRSKFDFDHLNHALRLLLKGAKLVAMQSELLDTSMGDIELNVGSWVGMLERAAGVKALSVGKPNSFVFELALRTMGLDKNEVVVVGDRISTDVRGAIDCGMISVLVKTGEFEENDLKGDILPDFVFDSVRDLVKLF